MSFKRETSLNSTASSSNLLREEFNDCEHPTDQLDTATLHNIEIQHGFYSFVPARHLLSFLIFWALFLCYACRVNLSVAIVAMVKQNQNGSLPTDNECPDSNNSSGNSTIYHGEGEFDWDEKTKGLVLGAFFYGYVITQIPGGRLAEIVGGKWLLGGGVLCTSIFTLLMPVAARWSIGALIFTRVMAGFGEGVTYPAVYTLFSKWIPSDEYSVQLACSLNGAQIGTVATLPIAALLCDLEYDNGWPLIFYIFGGLGCIWFLFWIFLTYNVPEDHPFISRKELRYIQDNRKTSSNRETVGPLPWKEILTCAPLWALTIVKFFSSWIFYTILTELPNYMQAILHFSIEKNAWQNSLLYLGQAVTVIIAGMSADYIRSNNYFSVTTIRKSYQTIALLGCSACIGCIPLVGCDKLSIFLLLVASMSILGFAAGGESPTVLDMAPNYAGTIFGICNSLCNLAGIFAPLVTGLIINDNDTLASWSLVFYIAAFLGVIGCIIFLCFGSAEVQPWAVTQYIPVDISDGGVNCATDFDVDTEESVVP